MTDQTLEALFKFIGLRPGKQKKGDKDWFSTVSVQNRKRHMPERLENQFDDDLERD